MAERSALLHAPLSRNGRCQISPVKRCGAANPVVGIKLVSRPSGAALAEHEHPIEGVTDTARSRCNIIGVAEEVSVNPY